MIYLIVKALAVRLPSMRHYQCFARELRPFVNRNDL